MNWHSLKKDKQMEDIQIYKCKSLKTISHQGNANQSHSGHHLTPSWMAITKKKDNTGEDVEKLEFSYITGKNVK